MRLVTQQQRRQRHDVSRQAGDEVLTLVGFLATVKENRVPGHGSLYVVLDLSRGAEVAGSPDAGLV